MKKKMTNPRAVVGRWFNSEKKVIEWLNKKEKELMAQGLTVGEAWYKKWRVICGKRSFLLVGEEVQYGLEGYKKEEDKIKY